MMSHHLWPILSSIGEEERLRDRFNNLVYDVTSPDLQDSFMFPNYSTHNDNRLEIIQEQGQIIFVPSGWHHQVYNLVRFYLVVFHTRPQDESV